MLEYWHNYLAYATIASIAVFFSFARYSYSYWERKGFKAFPNASFLFGHLKSVILQRTSMPDLIVKLYNSTSEPFIGMYGIFQPILLVRDPELVKNILVKDFSHFTDRGVYCDIQNDPLSGHLFSLPGEKWKKIRAKLTPAFSSGKLKGMFASITECGQSLQNHLHDAVKKGELVDIRDISGKYAINIIASVAFGIQVDTIKEPDNDFRKYGQQIVDLNLKNGLRFGLIFMAPKLMRVFGLHLVDIDVENFIRSVVTKNLNYRETNNFIRKDFFQLLLQLHRMGSVSLDDQFRAGVGNSDAGQKFTVDEMCAQTLLFYTAGFETSASTLSFCMFELAKNPQVQKRAQQEIDFVLQKHNGELSYEALQDMTYLENCIDETLRKYAVLPVLNRQCVKDYQIPGTQQVIEKGTDIFIPVFGLQYDEKYYPDPTRFNPDRFKESVSSGPKYKTERPYLGFGEGPRNCIGLRLGKIQTKVGLAVMLQHHTFELESEAANKEIKFTPKAVLIAPTDAIKLRIKRRPVNKFL